MEIPIRHRRGTADEWTADNPVLLEGQIGLELDTKRFKFGDGVTAWNALDYSRQVAAWDAIEDIPAAVTGLSGTNTGDETTESILTKIGDGEHIGAEYLPDALTFAGSDPNTGSVDTITVTGITDPTGTNPLVLTKGEVFDGKDSWYGSGFLFRYYLGPGQWDLNKTGIYNAYTTSPASSPVGLGGWLVPTGSGAPTISANPIPATHLGQLCKATTAWWQWDGTAWIPIRLLTGEPITTDGTDYYAITHDGSSLGYTPFP